MSNLEDNKLPVGKSKEHLAQERAIVNEYWETPSKMFEVLAELDEEYKLG